MAEKPEERRRPNYRPHAEYVQRLRKQSGLSIVDFAKTCGIGEKTLRQILAGEAVDFATLDKMAGKLKLVGVTQLSCVTLELVAAGFSQRHAQRGLKPAATSIYVTRQWPDVRPTA